jgi:hypothetical protein
MDQCSELYKYLYLHLYRYTEKLAPSVCLSGHINPQIDVIGLRSNSNPAAIIIRAWTDYIVGMGLEAGPLWMSSSQQEFM